MNDVERELAGATWRTSSYSGSGDQCVEVASLPSGHRAVRDSKDPGGPVLLFGHREWQSFADAVKARSRSRLPWQ
ncbi:MAG: hypothetical protein JWO67_4439 [Streptosporangiaceae bacterium]|nr:hypothetical protein [Streptosporangiaceae bacterium]